MTTKIFVDQSLLVADSDAKPIQIVEAQLSNQDHEEKLTRYGNAYSEFELIENLAESDFELIPYDLKTCIDLGLYKRFIERLQTTESANKRIAIFVENDDCLARHLHRPNLITFSHTGFKTLRSENEFCMPWFINDPLQIYRHGELTLRSKSAKPTIGFCGRAVVTPSRLGWQLVRNAIRTVRSWTRIDPFAAPRIASEVAFRSRILHGLEKSRLVNTDFILRSKFLAGISRTPVVRDDPFHPVRLEFINNLLDTDYTICVRGAANWSMRLYEALSCGRIPVFVDTDSILPFDFEINWKDYVVWVNEKDISRIDEVVADFHSSISDEDFVSMQIAGRKLWEDRLSRDGFFAHFRKHLSVAFEKSNSKPALITEGAG